MQYLSKTFQKFEIRNSNFQYDGGQTISEMAFVSFFGFYNFSHGPLCNSILTTTNHFCNMMSAGARDRKIHCQKQTLAVFSITFSRFILTPQAILSVTRRRVCHRPSPDLHKAYRDVLGKGSDSGGDNMNPIFGPTFRDTDPVLIDKPRRQS